MSKYQLKNLTTGKSSELEALSGTVGPEVISIATLLRDHGAFTFDPGFLATASTCASAGSCSKAATMASK